LEQRIKVIEENPTTLGTSDLINIAMLSLNNLKTVTDFILTVRFTFLALAFTLPQDLHLSFHQFIRQKADSLDLRSMAPICESVSQNPCFLDLIFQLYQPSDLLGPLEFLCNDWNRSNYTMDMDDNNEYGSQGQDVDDLQSSFEDFGKVWYLINLIISKFDVSDTMLYNLLEMRISSNLPYSYPEICPPHSSILRDIATHFSCSILLFTTVEWRMTTSNSSFQCG
jgi:hypothetical protein